MSDPLILIDALQHPNVQAFLRMLRLGEGTIGDRGYRVLFGGGYFEDFADHPRQAITRSLGGKPITSTAAGAYQFLARTWDGLVKQWGFADFTPKNQDLGAVALILGRKALDDVRAGRFESAVAKCNREWASLPGSPYGQPVVTMARARQEYETAGGLYTDPWLIDDATPAAATAAAVADPVAEPTTFTPIPNAEDSTMTPFIAAALPALIDLVPKLGGLFASGSETSQRNVAAAQIVVDAAKQAIGARNEQELLETIKTDPAAAQQVRQAIEANWYKIDEVGGGIQAARAANAQAAQPGAAPAWRQPAFLVTLLLLPLVYLVTWQVLTGPVDAFSSEVKSMVVAAIISGVLGALTGYWLGTSFSSQRKTELAAQK